MINTYLINNYNNKYWYKNGKHHHNCDLPAIEWINGDKFWYKNDKLHRDGDLPAIEWANDNKYWFKNGKLHHDGDLLAIDFCDGTKEWYKNGIQYFPIEKLIFIWENKGIDKAINFYYNENT